MFTFNQGMQPSMFVNWVRTFDQPTTVRLVENKCLQIASAVPEYFATGTRDDSYQKSLCECVILPARTYVTGSHGAAVPSAYSDKNEQLFQIVNFDEKYTDSDNLNSDSDNLNSDSNQNER